MSVQAATHPTHTCTMLMHGHRTSEAHTHTAGLAARKQGHTSLIHARNPWPLRADTPASATEDAAPAQSPHTTPRANRRSQPHHPGQQPSQPQYGCHPTSIEQIETRRLIVVNVVRQRRRPAPDATAIATASSRSQSAAPAKSAGPPPATRRLPLASPTAADVEARRTHKRFATRAKRMRKKVRGAVRNSGSQVADA